MTVAVVSDVHANLEALTVVLASLEATPHQSFVCLGDLVGYNPDPQACAELVLGGAGVVVRGNHDKAAAGLMELDWFSPLAARAVTWTRQQLSAPVLAGLRALPAGPVGLGAAGEGILACHGSPFDEDEYLTSVADFRRAFDFLAGRHPEVRICLFGHTHVPVAVEDRGGALRVFEDGEVRLAPGGRYLLNPGSVGQPRDGNPRASFAILDTDRGAWEVIRAAYPFRETARKIAAAGLPPELGARLAAGW